MAKKQRRRDRARHAAAPAARPAARPVAVPEHPTTAAPATRRSYAGAARAGSGVRSGAARAIGEPSPALERAATQERGFVVKDFRRIGVVVAIMVALLIVSDLAVNALLP